MTSATTVSDSGDYEVTVTGTDGHSDTTTDTNVFNITIKNQPPVVNETIPTLTAITGRQTRYTISANAFSDPESDSLYYSISTPGVTFISFNTGMRMVFINNSTNAVPNTYSILVRASDGISGNAAATQTVSA